MNIQLTLCAIERVARERERERELREREREERERERERERELPPWCAFNIALTETRERRGFTIGFTFYKVLIIMLVSLMFMADLCYIFIYIIKWFQKSPVCFWSCTKYENNCNWSMHTVEQIWTKKKHLKAIWPSQITVNIGHCIWPWNYW